MKKILLPLEGTSYHRDLLDFAAALNERAKIMLTTTLLPDADYAELWTGSGGVEEPVYIAPPENSDKVVANHCSRVKRYCEEHSIVCRVHEDRYDFALAALHRETRFADLLLLSSRHFFEAIDDRQPNAYMREILHHTECPVLLLPEKPALPGEIIFAYDGTASSVYAIRQFAYLFPEFNRLRTTLVCVSDNEQACIPEEAMIREWCEQHFKHFRALRLHMRTDLFYDTWLGMMQQPWLVSGAFGRSDWSRLFHHSFINRLIRTHGVPLFVAHK